MDKYLKKELHIILDKVRAKELDTDMSIDSINSAFKHYRCRRIKAIKKIKKLEEVMNDTF